MKIQIVKGHLVEPEHLKALVTEMDNVIQGYGLKLPEDPVLAFSSHMTTVGGTFHYRYKRDTGKLSAVTIKLNVKAYREFGFNNAFGALRHELAHWLDYVFNGNPKFLGRDSHGEPFKKICAELGGTMNSHMAGEKYASCATTEFLRTSYKWEYTCPTCGSSFKAKRQRKRNGRICLKCHTPFNQFKMKELE
jgi:predicted SprT family Zn-dependent metalloprotease